VLRMADSPVESSFVLSMSDSPVQSSFGGLYCPPVIPAGFLRIPEDSWGFPGLNIG
jgi:hypothetical protein